MLRKQVTVVLGILGVSGLALNGCNEKATTDGCVHSPAGIAFRQVIAGAPPGVSIVPVDVTSQRAPWGAPLPVEARFLVMSADGHEPEFLAAKAALDHRGTPYDTFIAN